MLAVDQALESLTFLIYKYIIYYNNTRISAFIYIYIYVCNNFFLVLYSVFLILYCLIKERKYKDRTPNTNISSPN